ncbi:MAG: MBL fold metallo-hydrolase [SAR202 cluster bacterium]|nr:MBL fold metallo-hydrolase [SAR202 cluster bacterium]|tara:strand:+ start:5360 stop:6181 length:822 start_codon:yes stop_codon:yes gene_type:complete
MQLTPHVYVCHIDDGADAHPGGSNNYFVGDPKEEMILIDTGTQDREWTRTILEYYEKLGSPKITGIAITHGHADHYGGVDRMYDAMQAPILCHPKLVKTLQKLAPKEAVRPLRSREMLETGGGVRMRAVFTPGHAVDHVCYHLSKERVLFTGDTILGSSSSTMQDLGAYMKSLELLKKFRHEIIAPAHGGVVNKPRAGRLVQTYIDHRNQRESQVLGSLGKGIESVEEMVKDIYPKNLKKGLRDGAARNVRNHLDKLSKEGRVSKKETFNLNK